MSTKTINTSYADIEAEPLRQLTVEKAAALNWVREAFRRFVETQDEWGAEAEAYCAVAALLEPFGSRDWHIGALGQHLLERRDGRWAMRG
jgi:hypothetical protein